MKVSFRIIAASYRMEDVAVELFGRSLDGRSVTALYFGFKPYFDVVEPDEHYISTISSDPEFVSMEDLRLWVSGSVKSVKRIYIRSPWKVPRFRNECPYQVLAADIPFHHRFIYDFDLGPCVSVSGQELTAERTNFTTDIVIRIETIENVEAFNPALKVMSVDVENSIKTREIFVIGWTIGIGDSVRKGSVVGGERALLENFVDLVQKEDPDIIIGYNIDGYDMPLIEERMHKLGVKFNISRDKIAPKRINGQYWRMHGRIVSDVWWNVKRILHPKSETLNSVAKQLLNEGKDNINRLKIEEEWKNRRQEVIDYCIKDSDLTLRIFNRLRIVDRNMYMSIVTKLPLDDVTNGGTSNYVDSLLIRAADRENIGVPVTTRTGKESPIEGGYVKNIGAGLYTNVIVLDFRSMYPSMIIKYNICFTTLDPNGTIVSPEGVRFLDKSVKVGLVPRLLEDLMKKRAEIKQRMKTSPKEERDFLDGVQGAMKILMNTFYGVLASSFYRFTNLEIGRSVTGYARETIKELMNELEGRGIKVIYGDTDSVFIESGLESVDETVKFGEELSRNLSEERGIVLEFEKVLDPFFSHGAKKRYAGRIVYPEENKGEVLVRGYEVRRTDSFDLQSEAQNKVFQLILNRDVDGAITYAKTIVDKIRSGDKDIPVEKLVISRSVQEFRDYKNAESLANFRVARKLKESGETFVPGMKVSWIVTNSKVTPQEVEPYIEGVPFQKKPDYAYYAKRVEDTLNRVLEGITGQVTTVDDASAKSKPLDSFPDSPSEKKVRTLDSF
ncbi:MAG: DNA polymerase II [Candidatus Thermoplasmatota archaeon]|nr:DNA polymerase II [Candidatus Thermoplasmatota archaeon]